MQLEVWQLLLHLSLERICIHCTCILPYQPSQSHAPILCEQTLCGRSTELTRGKRRIGVRRKLLRKCENSSRLSFLRYAYRPSLIDKVQLKLEIFIYFICFEVKLFFTNWPEHRFCQDLYPCGRRVEQWRKEGVYCGYIRCWHRHSKLRLIQLY